MLWVKSLHIIFMVTWFAGLFYLPRLFVYAADVAPVLADLHGRSDLSYLHRPASLEDVFLKLTGRDLRD